ncbi:MAG: Gfo/Idh/MocA family oxidoreductase [Gemmatimonadota bacterium]
MPPPSPLRAAVLGCGAVSYAHLWSWRSLAPLVELVAAADPDAAALRRRGAAYGVPHLATDPAELLERQRPDLVSICTPPQTHRALVERALGAGVRGILCEKPMALTPQDAAAMVRLCRESGVRLALGYQLRSQLHHREAARQIQAGLIGPPTFARALCQGPMISVGTHTFDLLCFLLGDPALEWVLGQAVFGEAPHGDRGYPEEVSSVGYYRFASGFTALFEGGGAATRFHHVYLEGAAGRLEARPFEEPKVRYRRHGHARWIPLGPLADADVPPLPDGLPSLPAERPRWDQDPPTATYPFRLELLELVRCVQEGRDHRASGERGRASLEAVLGLYESARRQALVPFPLV